MHSAAYDWVFNSFHGWRDERQDLGDDEKIDVLEIGSLDINGSIRQIFNPFARNYVGIDPQEGPGVDLVVSAVDYIKHDCFDVVVACEVFEHTPDYKTIIFNSMMNLREGGIFIATMAGEGRAPHSAIDEAPIRPWEHYRNIGEWELNQLMEGFFEHSVVNKFGNDVRCWGVK